MKLLWILRLMNKLDNVQLCETPIERCTVTFKNMNWNKLSYFVSTDLAQLAFS